MTTSQSLKQYPPAPSQLVKRRAIKFSASLVVDQSVDKLTGKQARETSSVT